MHLVSTVKLATAIREDRLDGREKAKYFFLLLAFMMLVSPFFGLMEHDFSAQEKLASSLAEGVIFLAGVYLCYRAARPTGARHFIEHFILLTIPSLTVSIAIGFILGAAFEMIMQVAPIPPSPFIDLAFTAAVYAAFFFWMLRGFRVLGKSAD